MHTSFRLTALLAEPELFALARRYVANCGLDYIDPELTVILIKTKTDAERDVLATNDTLLNEFRDVFRARDCPEELISKLVFVFKSQETVDRDYQGNWYWALS